MILSEARPAIPPHGQSAAILSAADARSTQKCHMVLEAPPPSYRPANSHGEPASGSTKRVPGSPKARDGSDGTATRDSDREPSMHGIFVFTPSRTCDRGGDRRGRRRCDHSRRIFLPIRRRAAAVSAVPRAAHRLLRAIPLAALIAVAAATARRGRLVAAGLMHDRAGHDLQRRPRRCFTPASNGNGGRDRRNARGRSATSALVGRAISCPRSVT